MFEWLFNHARADFDDGVLTFASSLSPWLLLTLIVIAALLLGFSLWTRRSQLSADKLWTLWTLQTLVAATLLTMLWRPTLKVEAISPGENTVAVLVDSSASMQINTGGSSRHDQAVELVSQQLLPDLQRNFTLKTGVFGATLEWTEDLAAKSPTDQRSNLSTALIEVLDQARTDPLTAVVIASDGSDNSGAVSNQFWDELAHYNVPVYTVGIGETTMANDTEVVSVELPPVALPGSVQTARVTVQHGRQSSVRIKVFSGDDLVALQDMPLNGTAGQSTVDIDIDANEAGIQELRFEAELTAGDISPANNSRRRLLQVKDTERKILYFEGEPRWEYKFIRRAVNKVPGISLVTLLRTTPNKFYRQGIDSPEQHANGFPASKEELYSYDAVIIGNVESVSLNATQQQLLHNYVSERGGALMMLAGDKALSDGGWHSSPVARTLPVNLLQTQRPTFDRTHATVQLASAGYHSPITRLSADQADNETQWLELPALADFQLTGEVKPGATVLLTATNGNDSYPLLSHQRYGAGNTYLLASSGTWRWQMQLPSEDQRHETFWRQLLTSVAAGAPQQLQTTTDRQIYSDEKQTLLTAKLFDNEFKPMSNGSVVATLTSPLGTRTTVDLSPSSDEAGAYTSVAEIESTGSWQIDIAAKDSDGTEISNTTNWIFREDGTAEQYALAQNDSLLKRISGNTNGSYHTVDNADEIAQKLRSSRAGIVREQSLPLWNAPLFFLLLIGAKLIEWLLRLRWGRL